MHKLVRSPNLNTYLKSTKQIFGAISGDVVDPFSQPEEGIRIPDLPMRITESSIAANAPKGQLFAQAGGFGTLSQVRLAHTDVPAPNFDYYRKKETKDPTADTSLTEESRKAANGLILFAGGLGAAYAAKNTVTKLLASMGAAADVLALAKIEVNLAEVPEGKSMTYKWRGKPLFVRHRTAEEIEREKGVDVASLRHPETDADRTQRPNFLVVIGVCTHLGCVPIPGAGDYGGYFCPCHGSHYDASGRIRKGPAPLNLEVPPHEYTSDSLLIVG